MRADLRKYRRNAGGGRFKVGKDLRTKWRGREVKERSDDNRRKRGGVPREGDYLSGKKPERRALHAERKATYAWRIIGEKARKREKETEGESRLTRSCGSRKTMVPPVLSLSPSLPLPSACSTFFSNAFFWSLSPPFGGRDETRRQEKGSAVIRSSSVDRNCSRFAEMKTQNARKRKTSGCCA